MADEKAHDVYLMNTMQKIGWKWGGAGGGLVYDDKGNVVGSLRHQPGQGQYYLIADQQHHTGKQWDGENVVWDNRPSK